MFITEPFLGSYTVIMSNGLAFINKEFLVAKTDDPLSLQKAKKEHRHRKYFDTKFEFPSMPLFIKSNLFEFSFGTRQKTDLEFGIINVVCNTVLSIAVSSYGNTRIFDYHGNANDCSVEIFNFDLNKYEKPKYNLSYFQKRYNIRDISGDDKYCENQYMHFNW